MSAQIIIMGRPTKDPVMAQSQNGTEYISLDLATSQRGQNGKDETVFYQCYFSKSLADRLLKAKVHKGSCLLVTGTLELHPFIYSQGNNAGSPGINANVRVSDWEYTIANRPENGGNPPANGQNTYNVPGNGQSYPQGNNGGAQTPGASGYPSQGISSNGYPQQNMQNQGTPNNGYSQPNVQNQGTSQDYPNSSYPTQTPNSGYPQGNYNGFQNVPQEQLPFPN